MIGEVGEVIDIVKKNGGTNASANPELRKDLVEELADVLMYYNDVLLCYGISADELKTAYTEKFEKNLKRWQNRTDSGNFLVVEYHLFIIDVSLLNNS